MQVKFSFMFSPLQSIKLSSLWNDLTSTPSISSMAVFSKDSFQTHNIHVTAEVVVTSRSCEFASIGYIPSRNIYYIKSIWKLIANMKGKDYAIFIKDLMTHYFDGRNDFYLICELSFSYNVIQRKIFLYGFRKQILGK